jgi:hypothetical protein
MRNLITMATLSTLSLVSSIASVPAFAEIRPEKIHVADTNKTKSYVHDGLITGGDRAIDSVIVKDIRQSKNPGFERIVIDLEPFQGGETPAIQRPPYFSGVVLV